MIYWWFHRIAEGLVAYFCEIPSVLLNRGVKFTKKKNIYMKLYFAEIINVNVSSLNGGFVQLAMFYGWLPEGISKDHVAIWVKTHQDRWEVWMWSHQTYVVLLMEEILHQKDRWKPISSGINHINWCRISQPSTVWIIGFWPIPICGTDVSAKGVRTSQRPLQ